MTRSHSIWLPMFYGGQDSLNSSGRCPWCPGSGLDLPSKLGRIGFFGCWASSNSNWFGCTGAPMSRKSCLARLRLPCSVFNQLESRLSPLPKRNSSVIDEQHMFLNRGGWMAAIFPPILIVSMHKSSPRCPDLHRAHWTTGRQAAAGAHTGSAVVGRGRRRPSGPPIQNALLAHPAYR